MKILISNIYGSYNLGDFAIRDSGIKIIKEAFPYSELYLLTESESVGSMTIFKNKTTKLSSNPYGIFLQIHPKHKSRFVSKVIIFLKIFFSSSYYALVGLLDDSSLPQRKFYKYIGWIKNADLVILMGGGYFYTRKPVSDLFGLVLDLLPLLIAKLYKKKILILPISYGPFASKLHAKIMKFAVSKTLVICRDKISLELARSHNKSAIYLPDLALYDWDQYKNNKRENYYTLTVREYLDPMEQEIIEKELSKFVDLLWEKSGQRCIFIPTGANKNEENDLNSAGRIKRKLIHKNAFKIITPKNPNDAKKIIRKANFAICTRMHSAIFSATEYTPFICLSYQHKIDGLLQDLNLSKWIIPFHKVTVEKIIEKYDQLFRKENSDNFKQTLASKREEALGYKSKLIETLRLSI